MLAVVDPLEARIRMRKVKEPPRTCAVMKMDELLSRPAKPVWSTERHSLVVGEQIMLVNDLGVKICSLNKDRFSSVGDITQFRFYIDEYKEVLYPYIDTKDRGFLVIKVPFATCSLDDRTTLAKFELPACEKPKKAKRKSSKGRNKSTKQK